jgi:hypothetical protein
MCAEEVVTLRNSAEKATINKKIKAQQDREVRKKSKRKV